MFNTVGPIAFILGIPFGLFIICYITLNYIINKTIRCTVSLLLFIKFKNKIVLADGNDCIFGNKKIGYTRYPMLYILIPSSPIDAEYIARLYTNKIQKQVDPKSGKRLYDKFEKIFIPIYGYFGWKIDEKFDVRNHVRFFNEKIYTAEDIQELISTDFDKDLEETKPQWEIVVFPKYTDGTNEKKTFIFIRWHHSYMDGVSIIMALKNHIANNFEYTIDPLSFKMPLLKRIAFYAHTFLCMWFPMLNYAFGVFGLKRFWILRERQVGLPQRKNYYWLHSNRIEMENIRKIRRNTNRPTVTNIITTAFTLAACKILSKDRILPEMYINDVVALFPYPNAFPQNRFAIFTYAIPTTKLERPLETLEKCRRSCLRHFCGPNVLLSYWFFGLIATLPRFMVLFFSKGGLGSLIATYLPLSKTKCSLKDGPEILEFGGWSPQQTDTGLSIGITSYSTDSMTIGGCADSKWLSKEEFTKIMEQIPEEIEKMAELCSSNMNEVV